MRKFLQRILNQHSNVSTSDKSAHGHAEDPPATNVHNAKVSELLPPEVESLLREFAGEDGADALHGMGQDIDLMPPHLGHAAMVLLKHYDATAMLRHHLSKTIAESGDRAVVHGAVNMMKKLGVDPLSTIYLNDGLVRVLNMEPPDDHLYYAALMLLNYCDQVTPLTDKQRKSVAARCASQGTKELRKFSSFAALLIEKQWKMR